MENSIFAAFVVDWKQGIYEIYLVNPTNVSYRQVLTYTGGAFCSNDDNGIFEISRAARNWGELRPHSYIRLGEDTTDQLSCMVWYWVDLFVAIQNKPTEKLVFGLPEYGYVSCYREKAIYFPVIEKKCSCLRVRSRDNSLSIIEQVAKDKQDKRIPFVFYNS